MFFGSVYWGAGPSFLNSKTESKPQTLGVWSSVFAFQGSGSSRSFWLVFGLVGLLVPESHVILLFLIAFSC